jgi:hypothetical protein
VQELSIHDNRVVSYEVDGERRRIVLHTRFEDRDPVECTDLVFEGVLAYYFENDNFGNILFGVEEIPVSQLVAHNRRLFEAGSKYAWPGPWNESPEASIQHFESTGAKAFEISSSYGLDGWVVADSYCLKPSGARAVS